MQLPSCVHRSPHCLITADAGECVAITTEEELTGNQLLSPSFKRKKKNASAGVTAHAKMRAHVIRWVKQANKHVHEWSQQ